MHFSEATTSTEIISLYTTTVLSLKEPLVKSGPFTKPENSIQYDPVLSVRLSSLKALPKKTVDKSVKIC